MAAKTKQDKTHTDEPALLKMQSRESFWSVKGYLEDRKMLARRKNRALYFTWNTVGSSRLYSFL